jgi:hypothetical protein
VNHYNGTFEFEISLENLSWKHSSNFKKETEARHFQKLRLCFDARARWLWVPAF